MKYQIIGKNIDITDAISSTLQKKLARMDKYFKDTDNVNCRVVCSVHSSVQKVEATIFLPKVTLRAEVRNQDLYAAIDQAIDKLEDQMRKLKTRASNSRTLRVGETLALNAIRDLEEKEREEEVVVRTKSYNLEPMTIDDAITEMEALGHSFFLYLDEDDNRISVVYERKDGGYGVIEAENPVK